MQGVLPHPCIHTHKIGENRSVPWHGLLGEMLSWRLRMVWGCVDPTQGNRAITIAPDCAAVPDRSGKPTHKTLTRPSRQAGDVRDSAYGARAAGDGGTAGGFARRAANAVTSSWRVMARPLRQNTSLLLLLLL